MDSLHIPVSFRKVVRSSFMVFLCVVFFGTQQAAAAPPSQAQRDLFKQNITRFDTNSCTPDSSAVAAASETELSNIYMLGDSALLGAYFNGDAPLKKEVADNGWTAKVDAAEGRGMEKAGTNASGGLPGGNKSGLEAIEADAAAIRESDTVVIELGTVESSINLPQDKSVALFKEQMGKAIQQVKDINSTAKIYWVNSVANDTDSTPYVQAYNQAIAAVADDRGVNLIDTTRAHIPLADNDITPTAAGYKKYSKVIASALLQTGTAEESLSGGGCCSGEGGGGDAALVGKDNEEKTWNYFKGKELSDEQTAGIMGNLMQESGFDPQIIEGGGRSKNPNDSGGGGWGLIQWTPGSKVIGMAHEAGLTEPIYLLSTQLDLVWEHMHNHPVVTGTFDLNHFKTIGNEVEAAEYFGSQIEGFGVAGDRWQDATDILNKYRGQGGAADGAVASEGGSIDCGAVDNSVSPECASAQGNVKILCEAKKYDVVSYVWGGGHAGGAAYHKACKTINTSNECGLDCSGLVSVAVYDAFGAISPVAWDTNSLRTDTKNWKEVSQSEAQPGDVMEPDAGHVEIVDHISGGKVYTFGAHTDGHVQEKQVGPTTWSASNAIKYFRFIGKSS